MIQYIFIISLAVLVAVALLAGYLHNRSLQKKLEAGEIDELPAIVKVDNECCGQHEVCEKDSLLAAVSKEVEYYNDEELDRFRNIADNNYTADDIEEFREILYTMKEDEVAGWARSLQLRSIPLPEAIKDEVFLIIGERRIH